MFSISTTTLVLTAVLILVLLGKYQIIKAGWRKLRVRPVLNRHWARALYLHGGTRRLAWFAKLRASRGERPAIARWAAQMKAYFLALYCFDRHAARRRVRGLATSLFAHREWLESRGETPYWQAFVPRPAVFVSIAGFIAAIGLVFALGGCSSPNLYGPTEESARRIAAVPCKPPADGKDVWIVDCKQVAHPITHEPWILCAYMTQEDECPSGGVLIIGSRASCSGGWQLIRAGCARNKAKVDTTETL